MTKRFTNVKLPATEYAQVRHLADLAVRMYYAKKNLQGRPMVGILLVAVLRGDTAALNALELARATVDEMDAKYHTGRRPG